jgi:adenosylhomocysteine nucleosidase
LLLFFKKEERLFFSEEKKQKTFTCGSRHTSIVFTFIVGLRAEANLLRHLDAPVFIGGGTAEGAAIATARAIASAPAALISFGLAGGLSPTVAPGALAIPHTILWRGQSYPTDPTLNAAIGGPTMQTLLAGETIAATAADKTVLHRATGAEAIDLETGPMAEAALAAGIPFATLRAICDPAGSDLPPAALAALNATGAIALARVLRSLAAQPAQLPALLALARDAALARRALQARVAHLQESQRRSPAWLCR